MRTNNPIGSDSAANRLADLGRFSEPALQILISLASGPKHGYLMNQDIEEFSGTRLGPGTLYGAITRLEARDLIEPVPSSNRRQPYRLTADGLHVLQQELADLQTTLSTGLERLNAQ
jgi:DNA-binding PadR family transcriptional regulator